MGVFFNHWSREVSLSPLTENDFEIKNHFTSIIDLSLSEDKILKQMSKGHKSTLKKSIKTNAYFLNINLGRMINILKNFIKFMSKLVKEL